MVGFASSFPNHSADDWVREQLGLLWFVCVLKEPSLRGAPSWLAAATWVALGYVRPHTEPLHPTKRSRIHRDGELSSE